MFDAPRKDHGLEGVDEYSKNQDRGNYGSNPSHRRTFQASKDLFSVDHTLFFRALHQSDRPWRLFEQARILQSASSHRLTTSRFVVRNAWKALSMAAQIETILKNARVDYHMWQPDEETYEILLMSRSGKGIVDVKVSRGKNKQWKVKSEVAEWLVDQILQSVGESADLLHEVKRERQMRQRGSKKNTKKSKKKSIKGSRKKKSSKATSSE